MSNFNAIVPSRPYLEWEEMVPSKVVPLITHTLLFILQSLCLACISFLVPSQPKPIKKPLVNLNTGTKNQFVTVYFLIFLLKSRGNILTKLLSTTRELYC